jgi:hypothetical protein
LRKIGALAPRLDSSVQNHDERGVWNGVRWNGQCASVFALCETDEKKAMAKLLRKNAECG